MARKQKPIKIITLDTETYNGLLGDLKRIAIYDGENVIYGYSFPEVEEILKDYHEQGYSVHVYIHNMEFDLRKMPELFQDNRIVWGKSIVISNKLAVLHTTKYVLHDSFKIFPQSLYKLSKGFEVECGKLNLWDEVEKVYPGEYTSAVDFLDRCHIDDELFLRYLGYDVISLYQVIYKAMELLGLSEADFVKRISTASLSRFLFKNGYKGQEFTSGNQSDYEIMCRYKWSSGKVSGRPALEIEEKIRESFCGGRTEVFKPVLTGGGFHHDVNSLYPSVMIDNLFPVGRPDYYDNPELAEYLWNRWQQHKMGLGFLKCTIYIPMQHIPPLPVKKGKLCFPCGVVSGTWTFVELDYAITHCGCRILAYDELILFQQTEKVFHNFVKEFYKIKEKASKEKNEALKTIAKLILNTGYGYTGMRRDDKTSLQDIKDLEKYQEKCVYVNDNLGYIEIESDITAEYIQVQIASYVTSYARLVLLDALRHAAAVGNVYYCDTDSIVTDKPLQEKIDDDKLGFWALESEPEAGIFLRPKVYAESYGGEDDVIRFKGVSKETQAGMAFSDYGRMLQALQELKQDRIPIEENKTVLPSIMVIEKNGLDLSTYYTRDKSMNLKTKEKRKIDYHTNKTKPYYFETLQDFIDFDFVHDISADIIW